MKLKYMGDSKFEDEIARGCVGIAIIVAIVVVIAIGIAVWRLWPK